MSSKRAKKRQAEKRQKDACMGKRKHLSYQDAEKAKRKMLNGYELKVYECSECRYFHIGHPPGFRTFRRRGVFCKADIQYLTARL